MTITNGGHSCLAGTSTYVKSLVRVDSFDYRFVLVLSFVVKY